MFKEIDYILEGQNAERFASLYGSYQCKFFHICNQLNYISQFTYFNVLYGSLELRFSFLHES